ncbi:hypothetical protein [Maribacter sp. 1_MG-2023]|uniref:hypothetical protein n=1 Tax=Maribacter sp. 1_MG-2023 TaxID=3062677 RepID=UPI0026E2FD83|nr:hypothetical protein [Maribacter sp. 1_MG-2023]MDO6473464.1 hypothetical protein [Maribacter sp. 1_MG-2023]
MANSTVGLVILSAAGIPQYLWGIENNSRNLKTYIMKNIRVVAVVAILAVTFISFKGIHNHKEAENAKITAIFDDCVIDLEAQLQTSLENDNLNPNDIQLVEINEEVNLGFDAFEYLPVDFNAYAGNNLTEQDFEIFENEEIVELGFDTAAYLPNEFNAYAL